MSAGGNFTGFEKSPDWIFPQMQKKHFLSRGPTPYLLVSHALAHSYAYASLITLSKSIPDIFRLISRQQVFSVHLFQSLEICFEFQCTYCCLYFMTKSGSRDRSYRISSDFQVKKESIHHCFLVIYHHKWNLILTAELWIKYTQHLLSVKKGTICSSCRVIELTQRTEWKKKNISTDNSAKPQITYNDMWMILVTQSARFRLS